MSRDRFDQAARRLGAGVRRASLARELAAGHEHLYRTSPSFQHNIDHLAAMMIMWVDGIAVSSVEEDRAQRDAMELLARTPPPPLHLGDLTTDDT